MRTHIFACARAWRAAQPVTNQLHCSAIRECCARITADASTPRAEAVGGRLPGAHHVTSRRAREKPDAPCILEACRGRSRKASTSVLQTGNSSQIGDRDANMRKTNGHRASATLSGAMPEAVGGGAISRKKWPHIGTMRCVCAQGCHDNSMAQTSPNSATIPAD